MGSLWERAQLRSAVRATIVCICAMALSHRLGKGRDRLRKAKGQSSDGRGEAEVKISGTLAASGAFGSLAVLGQPQWLDSSLLVKLMEPPTTFHPKPSTE